MLGCLEISLYSKKKKSEFHASQLGSFVTETEESAIPACIFCQPNWIIIVKQIVEMTSQRMTSTIVVTDIW